MRSKCRSPLTHGLISHEPLPGKLASCLSEDAISAIVDRSEIHISGHKGRHHQAPIAVGVLLRSHSRSSIDW